MTARSVGLGVVFGGVVENYLRKMKTGNYKQYYYEDYFGKVCFRGSAHQIIRFYDGDDVDEFLCRKLEKLITNMKSCDPNADRIIIDFKSTEIGSNNNNKFFLMLKRDELKNDFYVSNLENNLKINVFEKLSLIRTLLDSPYIV